MDLNRIVFKFVSISFSVLIALLIILGLIRLGEYCYDFGYRVFTEEPVDEEPGTDVVVLISDDMSEYEVGVMLAENGLIRDEKLFYAQLKLSAYSGQLLPGVYTLNTSMTAKEMMAVMATEASEEEEESEETQEEESEETQEEESETQDVSWMEWNEAEESVG